MKTLVLSALAYGCMATIAAACPNPNLPDNYGTYQATGAQLYQAKAFGLNAGGNMRISDCGYIRPRSDQGDGFVTEAPDFSFSLNGMDRYSLAIAVESQCDSVLLINTGSTSWYYDDDDNHQSAGDALITLTRPANGRIDIWVGTYDGAVCEANLILETFDR